MCEQVELLLLLVVCVYRGGLNELRLPGAHPCPPLPPRGTMTQGGMKPPAVSPVFATSQPCVMHGLFNLSVCPSINSG